MPVLSTVMLAFQVAATQALPAAVRNPAFARDGRLAVSMRGDLWIVSPGGQWTPLTTGPAWDREPAWSPDGSSIVFSSDRAGNVDIWRVTVSPGGPTGDPVRITSSP